MLPQEQRQQQALPSWAPRRLEWSRSLWLLWQVRGRPGQRQPPPSLAPQWWRLRRLVRAPLYRRSISICCYAENGARIPKGFRLTGRRSISLRGLLTTSGSSSSRGLSRRRSWRLSGLGLLLALLPALLLEDGLELGLQVLERVGGWERARMVSDSAAWTGRWLGRRGRDHAMPSKASRWKVAVQACCRRSVRAIPLYSMV